MAATMSPAFAARSPTGVLIPIARKMNVLTMSAPVLRVLKIEIFVWGLVACSAPRLPIKRPATTVAITPETPK